MKTILELLNEIPDKEVREKALRNCIYKDHLLFSYKISSALLGSVDFAESPEGFEYWFKEYNKLKAKGL